MFKKCIASCLLMVFLVGCGADDEVNQDDLQNQNIVSSDDTKDEIVTDEDLQDTLKNDIYELYPIGKMYGKTTEEFKAELSENYEINSSQQEDGYTKHTIMTEHIEYTSFDAVTVLTDANDIVMLVTYTTSQTITDNYDDDLKESVENINEIYNILLNQGEELELVYSQYGTEEAGTIVDLVTDFNSQTEFIGGNYESRFNIDGVEVETGILYMLQPETKEGLFLKTLTFEEYIQ